MKKRYIHKNDSGFTLIELMITVAISGLVIVVVSWIYTQQQRVRNSQESVVDIQQNLRSAVYLIGQEIRMAGYDPTGKANARITAATTTSLSFDQDLTGNGLLPPGEDGDGDVNDPNENITLNLVPTLNPLKGPNILTRGSTAAGPAQPMIQNVEQLEFRYTLKGFQTPLPAPPNASQIDDIRSVTISMLVRAVAPETGFFQ